MSAFLDYMVDEMGTDGSLPDVVPFQRFGGRPADLSWSAAFLENLWQLWQKDTAKRALTLCSKLPKLMLVTSPRRARTRGR